MSNINDILSTLNQLSEKNSFKVYIPSLKREVAFKPLTSGQQKLFYLCVSDNLFNSKFITSAFEIFYENPKDHMDTDKLFIDNFISWIIIFLNNKNSNNPELLYFLNSMIENNKLYVVAHSHTMQEFIKSNNILNNINPDINNAYKEIIKTNTWTIDLLVNFFKNNNQYTITSSNIKIIEGMKQPQENDIESLLLLQAKYSISYISVR